MATIDHQDIKATPPVQDFGLQRPQHLEPVVNGSDGDRLAFQKNEGVARR